VAKGSLTCCRAVVLALAYERGEGKVRPGLGAGRAREGEIDLPGRAALQPCSLPHKLRTTHGHERGLMSPFIKTNSSPSPPPPA